MEDAINGAKPAIEPLLTESRRERPSNETIHRIISNSFG
jgi:hypothetical protein